MALFKARIVGSLQWVCPNCLWIHGSEQLNWRRPRVRCHMCDARWMVGIVIMAGAGRLGSLTMFKAPAPWVTGAINAVGTGYNTFDGAIGRFVGSIEMRCPLCHTAGRQAIAPVTSVACCVTVAPILHRLTKASSHYAPTDWTPDAPLQTRQDRPAAPAARQVK